MRHRKNEYNNLTKLYYKQKWLTSKKDELNELINFCGDNDSKELVFSLLGRFSYIEYGKLNILLNEIADYIVDESGYHEETTQILAMTYDEEADSGQKILDYLKLPIYKKGWRSIKTVNYLGKGITYCNRGKNEIILIDEFIGSGKSLRGRINYLRKSINVPFTIKCCFVAGIKETIADLISEGIEIFCPLQLEKGISDYYKGHELTKAEDLMLDLELKLAPWIKSKELYQYSFGYGGVEALYTLEGCNGNTPNSAFPIFWWLYDKEEKQRRTILTRFETGF